MNRQSLFSGKIRKNINLSSADTYIKTVLSTYLIWRFFTIQNYRDNMFSFVLISEWL